ncbi:alpha/beta-hydrolase [Aspergillus uvarum CBS 121591]|uniref:Alpha/beta-hydrolase n=1 Tax=Aspergillus uvarum CBS 121591 TaxID=1448315 RepID=A0A319BZM4_9EURO|nr:alpha/beta-hydrolase [Aspergillus uvarum CBS 121591]PYH78225.1 alpha/beta-hydrolase [Aspergillus uvarum CBS 121591]
MTTRTYGKHTHVYQTHFTTDIQLDVYLPPDKDSKTPKPILLWFHGGYLVSLPDFCMPKISTRESNAKRKRTSSSAPQQVTGSRKAIPAWLLHHALTQNWTLISADYRVLPESTGLATTEDAIAAYEWVAGGALRRLHPDCTADPDQIVLAGASAGGWCALVTALHFTPPASTLAEQTGQTPLPPPKALWLLYPLLDLGSRKWAQSVALPGAMAIDPAAAERLLQHEIPQRIARAEISVGEDFPSSEEEMRTRQRLPLLYSLLERGVFLDFLTGSAGFGERVVGLGLDGAVAGHVQENRVRGLFPLDDGAFGPGFPATIVVHGTDDREVSCGESERLMAKLLESGAEVQYFPVDGAGHVFDLELREGLRDGEGGQAGATLVRALQALQRYLEGIALLSHYTPPSLMQKPAFYLRNHKQWETLA